MANQTESGVIFHNQQGHTHDGINSTKIDFSTYTEEELASILDKTKSGQITGTQSTSSSSTSSAISNSDSIFYHMSGSVQLSPEIVAHKVFHVAATSIEIAGTLGVVGTSSTTITIYKNGSPIGQLVMPASQGYDSPVVITINSSFNGSSDNVSARVTDAGDDAQELGVEIRAIIAT